MTKTRDKVEYLGRRVDIGPFVQERGDHVRMPLLGGQVQRGHTLLGHDIRLGPVAEERGCDLHLVLLGSNVQGSVAILQSKRKQRESLAAAWMDARL